MSSLQVLRELILKSANKHCGITQKEYEGSCQISLAHVLIVLEKEFEREYHKMIFQDNKFMFICARYEAPQFYWELTKDLDEQSDSTIKTLLKLMKGE